MIQQRTIAIVGLGVIGGSLARDLAARGARVMGYDRNPETVRRAVASGHVQVALDEGLTGSEAASWLIIAVPVDETARVLAAIAPSADNLSLITDVGSTKRRAVEAARELGLSRFVGSHPLAGDHRSGWSASRAGLFAAATVFLCADVDTAPEAVEHAHALWEGVGARTTVCSATEHDERMAWVSHLPHMASFAMALAIGGQGLGYGDLGPGGRDAMRLAASSPGVWRAIAMENAGAIARSVGALEAELQQLREALERGDGDELETRLALAASWQGAG